MTELRNSFRKEEIITNLIMAMIVATPMGAFAAYLVAGNTSEWLLKTSKLLVDNQVYPMELYTTNLIWSIILSILVTILMPFRIISRRLTLRAGAESPSIKYCFLYALPIALGNTIVIDLFLCLIDVLRIRDIPWEDLQYLMSFEIMWFDHFFVIFLPTLILSYLFYVLFGFVLAVIPPIELFKKKEA